MPLKRRVAIIEDNTLELEFLEALLIRFHDDIEVVGKFNDTHAAWSMLAANQVEGIFLDIGFQEQGETAGLLLAHKLKARTDGVPKPWVIFVTGSSEHAREALQVRPFGFLDKPVRDLDLENILNEVRQAFPLRQPRISIRYAVNKGGHRVYLNRFLDWEEVVFIHADNGGNDVLLNTGEILKDVNLTLKEWLDLNIPALAQIHRKTIVNLKHVGGYRGNPEKGRHTAFFKIGTVEFEIGDNYFKTFKAALERFV